MQTLMVVQGGGPTQVLNATLAGILDEARESGQFNRVFGARFGTRGLIEGRVVDLGSLSTRDVELLRITPGAALGSSRHKPSDEEMRSILACLENVNVRDLLFIGGNGTIFGADRILRSCGQANYDVRVVGIPKTVDNDMAATDRCPGYASAARYVAQSARDLGVDIRSLPQPVSILETMGRSVGWLAAAAAAGKRDEADAPHLIYIPEIPFAIDEFIADLDRVVVRYGWAVVVVSEGLRDAAGQAIYQKTIPAQADPLNRPITGGVGEYLADQVAARLGIRCRCEKPGLLGRASFSHVSVRDLQDATVVGRAGVRGLLAGRSGEMVSLLPLKDSGESKYQFVGFDSVAGVERGIPSEWLSASPIPLKPSFFEYLQPLIGELLPSFPPVTSVVHPEGAASHAKD